MRCLNGVADGLRGKSNGHFLHFFSSFTFLIFLIPFTQTRTWPREILKDIVEEIITVLAL